MAFPDFQTKEVLNKVLNTDKDALKVDIDNVTLNTESSTVSLEVDLDHGTDDVLVYANTNKAGSGTSYVPLVDSDGHLQIDVLSITAGDNNIGNVDIASIAAGDNNIGNVDIVSVPAPLSTTGGGGESGALRVTIANDSTGVVSVDDGGGALTVDGTVDLGSTATTHLSEIEGAVETIEGAVSGSQMQVDVVAISAQSDGTYIGDIKFGESLPAGSAAIGKLAANDGVDIGDVDVTSVTTGHAAANLGKREDDVHANQDVGVMALAVRNDDVAAIGAADGDYAPLQVNAAGSLYTTDATGEAGSILVTGTTAVTTTVTANTIFTAIQFIEDTVFDSGNDGLISATNQLYPSTQYASTSVDADGGAVADSVTFPQGMTIFGRWSGFKLASGKVIAYIGYV